MATFEKKGLHGVSWWENGLRKLSANKEIRTPADLKDVKLRTIQNQLHIDYFTSMGAKVFPLPFSQVYQALKDGTLDAQENPFSNIVCSKFYEAQKFVIGTDHVYGTNAVILSKVFWDKLDDSDKKKFSNLIEEEKLVQRKLNRDQDKEYIDLLTKNNVKYISLTDEEKMA